MTAQGQAFSRGKNAPCWFYGAVSVPNTTPDTLCRVFFFFLHLSGLSAECPIKHLVPGREVLVNPVACLNLVKDK